MLSLMRLFFSAATTCSFLVHVSIQADTDAVASAPTLEHAGANIRQFLPRAGTPGTFDDGQVAWVDLSSGDGVTTGNDADKIWYIKDAIDLYIKRFPDSDARTGLFWAGGYTAVEDFEAMDEFAEINLGGNAHKADDIFTISDFTAMGLDGTNKNNLWWRAINRMSKALAAGATNGKAYVYLGGTSCRTLFSPPSQNPQDIDPSANGQATNGEIFYYAELPMLMRNTNIQQIITFSKVNRKFVQKVGWDVNRDIDKPRNFLPDIAIDATPIVLPPAAGRPPLKRDVLPRDSTSTTLQYQSGFFNVDTIFVPGLTTNSATTCTATSNSQIITTAVPIWACTACSSSYNAILVSPSSVWGPVGIPSPPPSYPPLSIGSDLLITPVALPTATSIPGETYIFLNSTFHGPTTMATIKSSGFGTGSSTATTQGVSSGSSLNSLGTTTRPPYPTTAPSQPTNPSQGTGLSQKSSLNSGVGTSVGTGTETRQDSSTASDLSSSSSSTESPSLSKNTTLSVTSNISQTSSSINSTTSSAAIVNTSSSAEGPSTTGFSGSTSSSSFNDNTSSPGSSDLGPSLVDSTIVTSGPSGVETKTVTLIQGGQITTPIPVTATQTLNPTGIIASSSARELQSSLVAIFPIIKSLIDNPEKPKATDAINAIKGVQPFAENLLGELRPDNSGSPKPCSGLLKRNLIGGLVSDLFSVVSCVVNDLENTTNDIENGIKDEFSNIDNVTSDLSDLDKLQKPLDTDSENNSTPSQSQTNPSDSSQTQSSTQTSSSTSCTETQTVSDCRVACPTSQSASQSCTTTCYSTVTGCSVTGTTSTTTDTADACTLPNGGATTTVAVPQGPYITAWWDYGISCAGSCTGFAQPSGSVTGGTATSTGSVDASTTTTRNPPTATDSSSSSISLTVSNYSNSSIPIITSQTSASSTGSETGTVLVSTTIDPSSISTPTDPSPTTTTNPLSCAPTDSVPTGVPQSHVQNNITEWCSDDVMHPLQPGVGCDYPNHHGFWLTTSCNIPKYELQFYFPGVVMYFNVSLADGSSEFMINSTTCDSALHTVLNGCPPLSAPPDQPLMKYGGSLPISDGNGHSANFQIILHSNPGDPGEEPGL